MLTVDDHAVVRSGIVGLLESEPGIRSVGAVGSCRAALTAFEEHLPDVVIADFRLPDGDGLALCRQLERNDWPSRVLVFSGFASTELAAAATVAGAAGVLGKGTAGELLLAAVRAVAGGGMPPPRIGPDALRRASETIDGDDRAILAMRLEGSSTLQIAEVLQADRAEIERRVDRVVDALKPRVDPPPLGALAGSGGRQVGRWV